MASAAPGVLHVPAGVLARGDLAQDLALEVDDPFRDAEDGVLLHVENLQDSFDERVRLDRRLGHEDDIRLAVSRAERDHAAVSTHHLDDRDSPVAFGRGPDSLDADRRDVGGRGHSRASRSSPFHRG